MKITFNCDIDVLEYKNALEIHTTGFKGWFAKRLHKIPYFKRNYIDKEVIVRIIETLNNDIPKAVKEGFAQNGIDTEVTIKINVEQNNITTV